MDIYYLNLKTSIEVSIFNGWLASDIQLITFFMELIQHIRENESYSPNNELDKDAWRKRPRTCQPGLLAT